MLFRSQREFASQLQGLDPSEPEGAKVLEDLARQAFERAQVLALLLAVPEDDKDLPIGCLFDVLIVVLGESRARLAVWRAARCAADSVPDLPLRPSHTQLVAVGLASLHEGELAEGSTHHSSPTERQNDPSLRPVRLEEPVHVLWSCHLRKSRGRHADACSVHAHTGTT